MKKSVCILMFVVPISIFSQESSFGITGGYATNGFGAHASYNYEFSENDYFQVSLFASDNIDKSKNDEIPYRTISLNLGYYYNVLRSRNSQFSAALGGGGSVGYEILNNGDTVLDSGAMIEGNTQIVYGGFVGSELKYYLSDTFALLGVVNTYLYANSDLGTASLYSGLGIKFYIY